MGDKRKKILKRAIVNIGFPILSVAALIAVYAAAAAVVNESLILPNWGEIFRETGRLLSDGGFYKALAWTLLRAFIAFLCAFAVGFALGAAAFCSKTAERFIFPVTVAVRALPTVAVIFLFVLWFRSVFAPAVIAFTVIMPMFYTSSRAALDTLDKQIFEMSRVYKVPKKRVIAKFVLPQIAPPLIDAAAGNLSFAVKLVIAGEALAQTAVGLGGTLNLANAYLETARLMAVTMLAVVVCFILEGAVSLLKIPSGRWR